MNSSGSRTAIVTGGGRGIGLGITQSLLRESWNVVFCGTRPPDDLKNTLADLENLGTARYVQANLGLSGDREKLMKAALEAFGSVDLLVNNAGIAPRQRLDVLETTENSFDEVLNINAKAPYFMTQLVANHMVDRREKDRHRELMVIVNISSVSAVAASDNRGEYCMSKAALSMASKVWALRLGSHNIPVYEIRPGIVTTDMTAKVKDKYDAMIENGLLVEPRWGKPEDIGSAVAMLARGDLPYATGQVLTLDGGMLLSRL